MTAPDHPTIDDMARESVAACKDSASSRCPHGCKTPDAIYQAGWCWEDFRCRPQPGGVTEALRNVERIARARIIADPDRSAVLRDILSALSEAALAAPSQPAQEWEPPETAPEGKTLLIAATPDLVGEGFLQNNLWFWLSRTRVRRSAHRVIGWQYPPAFPSAPPAQGWEAMQAYSVPGDR